MAKFWIPPNVPTASFGVISPTRAQSTPTRAAALGSVVSGIALFSGFFAGTTVYLLLFFPLGCAGRWEEVRTVGRIAAVIAGIFYLVMGIIALL